MTATFRAFHAFRAFRTPATHLARLARLALAAAVAFAALGLAGCASSHPVTKAGEACASCHGDGREASAGTEASDATETGLTFAVESSADEIYLCTVSLAEDGTAVPARLRTLGADDLASVTVSEPGLYALCTGDMAAPSATVLVNATENGPADVTATV